MKQQSKVNYSKLLQQVKKKGKVVRVCVSLCEFVRVGYLAKSCGGGQLIGEEDSVVHNNHSYNYS